MTRPNLALSLVVLGFGASFACGGSVRPAETSPAASGPASTSEATPKGTVTGGSLAPVQVKKALVARKDDVKACYHALLEKNKKASGKVVLRFTVGLDGKVEEVVTMDTTTLPDETAKCIADVVRSVQFPLPEGGKATITYPWEFTAE